MTKTVDYYGNPSAPAHEASTLHEVLDPDGRIPTDYSISIARAGDFIEGNGRYIDWLAYHDDDPYDPIAKCTLNIRTDAPEPYMCFDGIKIFDRERYGGKGYGLALYLEAILHAQEQGLPFRTQDYDQTEHAVRIWQLLHSLGIAREITPFAYDHTVDRYDNDWQDRIEEPRYKGHYVVDVAKPS